MSDDYLTPEEIQNLLRSLQTYADILTELMDEFGAMHEQTTLLEARNWFLDEIAVFERKTRQKTAN